MDGNPFFSFLSIRFAARMFAPTASPDEIVTMSAMISVFVPTAASESALPKYPATAVSAALKSCCTILLSAMGSVNYKSFPASGPCSISISEAFISYPL